MQSPCVSFLNVEHNLHTYFNSGIKQNSLLKQANDQLLLSVHAKILYKVVQIGCPYRVFLDGS